MVDYGCDDDDDDPRGLVGNKAQFLTVYKV